jgi:hypothetical protein
MMHNKLFLLPIWHILHPLKYVCAPNATICQLLRSLHVRTHSIITSNSKFWQNDSFLDHKKYIMVVSIFCPLSTSYICVSIHAKVVFNYQYDTLHSLKWRIFWGASLWWDLKFHSFNMSFTHEMKFVFFIVQ